jgi:hypothetical protein
MRPNLQEWLYGHGQTWMSRLNLRQRKIKCSYNWKKKGQPQNETANGDGLVIGWTLSHHSRPDNLLPLLVCATPPPSRRPPPPTPLGVRLLLLSGKPLSPAPLVALLPPVAKAAALSSTVSQTLTRPPPASPPSLPPLPLSSSASLAPPTRFPTRRNPHTEEFPLNPSSPTKGLTPIFY